MTTEHSVVVEARGPAVVAGCSCGARLTARPHENGDRFSRFEMVRGCVAISLVYFRLVRAA